MLSELGVDAAAERHWAVPCAGIAAAWGEPTAAQRPSLLNPYGRGWCVDRRAFDRMLFERAHEAGAVALMQCRVASAERRGSEWTFALDCPTGRKHGRAKWVVAATGRSAPAPLGPCRRRIRLDRLVGIALIEQPNPSRSPPRTVTALVEAVRWGWWYSAVLPDGRGLAVFHTDADLLPRTQADRAEFLRDQFAGAPLTRARCEFVDERIGGRSWKAFDARSSVRRMVVADGWVVIGDAAIALDPLCGRGVSEALRSGIEVADWLLQSAPVQADGLPTWVGRAALRFNDFCAQRLAVYREETRWRDAQFWRRRLHARG